MKCAWCGAEKERMTIWRHRTGTELTLCFLGCQWFLEPFRATGLTDSEWSRVDPWRRIRRQPRLKRG